jgi:AhpD family alkylhydroperoxidase
LRLVVGLVTIIGRLAESMRRDGGRKRVGMSRAEVEADIRETIGLVPEFISEVPDSLIETEWQSFKTLMLSETEIPNKYKELIGLGVSGATRCRYCVYYHTEAARLFGATEEEINETALVAKNTMGWSTYLNARAFDYDRFTKEFDQIAEYVRSQMAAAV